MVVAILDRDNWTANTDIIVVVDADKRRLVWVPRDLWSPLVNDRVNAAFAKGGGGLLLDALAELGLAAGSRWISGTRSPPPAGSRMAASKCRSGRQGKRYQACACISGSAHAQW